MVKNKNSKLFKLNFLLIALVLTLFIKFGNPIIDNADVLNVTIGGIECTILTN